MNGYDGPDLVRRPVYLSLVVVVVTMRAGGCHSGVVVHAETASAVEE